MAQKSEQKKTPPKGFEQSSFGGRGCVHCREEVARRGHSGKHQGLDWLARSPDGERDRLHRRPTVRPPLWTGGGPTSPTLWESTGGSCQRALWLCDCGVRDSSRASTKGGGPTHGGADAKAPRESGSHQRKSRIPCWRNSRRSPSSPFARKEPFKQLDRLVSQRATWRRCRRS